MKTPMHPYRDTTVRKLSPHIVLALLAEHRTRYGDPACAALHPRNEKWAPVLEAEGVSVEIVGGCLANEVWFGRETAPEPCVERTEQALIGDFGEQVCPR